MSNVDPRHIHNFNVCVEALFHGDIVLLTCTDVATGRPTTVGVVISGTAVPGESVAFPMFRMFDSDPLQEVKLPDDMAAVFEEHKQLKLLAMQAANAEPGAEPGAELPPAGSLH